MTVHSSTTYLRQQLTDALKSIPTAVTINSIVALQAAIDAGIITAGDRVELVEIASAYPGDFLARYNEPMPIVHRASIVGSFDQLITRRDNPKVERRSERFTFTAEDGTIQEVRLHHGKAIRLIDPFTAKRVELETAGHLLEQILLYNRWRHGYGTDGAGWTAKVKELRAAMRRARKIECAQEPLDISFGAAEYALADEVAALAQRKRQDKAEAKKAAAR